jgi:hypothetical protein
VISHVNIDHYDSEAFDRGTKPVLELFSADQTRQIAAYQADDALRRDIEALAAKSNEGTLTPAERAKYEGYVRANKFVAILQAQARKILASQQQG